ncbi:hypothetical protein A7979_00685 [Rothia nasimurium]|uniref:Uncharacterized protein n=1 Tax=Rothia nasimurium TaxID=85336 RepID=A0A1Y1RQJ4_9MICC|nr:hypothetical protein [Rothia nasimurium]ORC22066.1 hypothetical protein A7979_00685 [Rothia nasimurium]
MKDEVKKLDLYLIGSLSNLPEGSFLRNEYEATESKEIMFNYPSDPAYLMKIVLEDRGLSERQLDEIQNEAESKQRTR